MGTCFIGQMTLFFSIERARPYFEAASCAHFENEVNCRCNLQGFKDPRVLNLVRDRKTEIDTLSTNGRAMTLQLIASCRFALTMRDVKSIFVG